MRTALAFLSKGSNVPTSACGMGSTVPASACSKVEKYPQVLVARVQLYLQMPIALALQATVQMCPQVPVAWVQLCLQVPVARLKSTHSCLWRGFNCIYKCLQQGANLPICACGKVSLYPQAPATSPTGTYNKESTAPDLPTARVHLCP